MLVIASVYAGATHKLEIAGVIAAAAAGAIVGDNIGYAIGRMGGYRLLLKFGHRVRVKESHLKVARYVFDRYGEKVVFLGRFVAILRTYAAFLAGVGQMEWRRFLIANAAGGIVWALDLRTARLLRPEGVRAAQHADQHHARRARARRDRRHDPLPQAAYRAADGSGGTGLPRAADGHRRTGALTWPPHGRRPAAPHAPIRPRHRRLARRRRRAAVRRDRRPAESRTGLEEPVQRGRGRPPGGQRRRPLPARPDHHGGVAPAGRRRPASASRPCGR